MSVVLMAVGIGVLVGLVITVIRAMFDDRWL